MLPEGNSSLLLPILLGDLEPTFGRCCAFGANWARESKVCSAFPLPVAGVPSEHQSICVTAAGICCLRYYRYGREVFIFSAYIWIYIIFALCIRFRLFFFSSQFLVQESLLCPMLIPAYRHKCLLKIYLNIGRHMH